MSLRLDTDQWLTRRAFRRHRRSPIGDRCRPRRALPAPGRARVFVGSASRSRGYYPDPIYGYYPPPPIPYYAPPPAYYPPPAAYSSRHRRRRAGPRLRARLGDAQAARDHLYQPAGLQERHRTDLPRVPGDERRARHARARMPPVSGASPTEPIRPLTKSAIARSAATKQSRGAILSARMREPRYGAADRLWPGGQHLCVERPPCACRKRRRARAGRGSLRRASARSRISRATRSPRCRPSSMTASRSTRPRRSCAISTKGSRSRRCSRPICTNSRG